MAFVGQKVKDEGTTSPYMARLWIGIMELRDGIISSPSTKRKFDDRYGPVLKALDKTREAAREVQRLLADHRWTLTQPGMVEIYPNGHIMVHHPVSEALAQAFDSFTLFAQRAIKLTQNVLREIGGVDIGFLFQKSTKFESGREKMEASHPELAAYLLAARSQLTETLIALRNDIEHEGWTLPALHYQVQNGHLEIGEPMVAGMSLSAYVAQVANRVSRLVEDLTAYALQTRLVRPQTILELPEVQRASIQPKRFALGLEDDYRAWRLLWVDDTTDFLWNGR